MPYSFLYHKDKIYRFNNCRIVIISDSKNNSEPFIVTLAYVLYNNWCNSTREKAKTKNNNN